MRVRNVFRVNDWKMPEFLVAVFSLQFGLLGLEMLGALGYDVPLLRPIVGFVYLTFVPGALLMRALRIHHTSNVESVLYMAGLSLAFDMLVGLLINLLYPFVGIDQPITEHYIVLSMLLGVALLAALCYLRDRDYRGDVAPVELDAGTLAPALFLLLIPLTGALSSYLVNAYNFNALTYVLILAVALVVLLCGFGRLIPERLYPLAILATAAGLLFHNAFVTGYLWSWDVHHEYNIANLVVARGLWDTSVVNYLNSMLSVVFLVPFYHHVCGVELTWVFKIAYQLIYCLVPLGLYVVFRRQAGSRIACLACMFFMSLVTFYTEMQGLTRQEIAELFLVLIVMLMTDTRLDSNVKALLKVVFGFALIVSHYGLAYVYLLVFPLALALYSLAALANKWAGGRAIPADRSLTLKFVGLFTCFLLIWYMNTSGSSAVSSITYILDRIMTNLFDEFLNPEHVQGLSMLMQGPASPLYAVKKYLHLAFQGLIAIGLAVVVLGAGRKAYQFSAEYVIFALINLLICGLALVVPYFASSLNTSRLYQITLVILAPLCIIGGVELFRAIASPLGRWKINTGELAIRAMALAVVVYLLFNTGLVFHAAGDHPMSVSLSKGQIDSYCLQDRAGLYDALNTFEQDYHAAGWLGEFKAPGKLVFSDYIAHYPVSSYGNTSFTLERYYLRDLSNVRGDSYIYLGYPNLKGNVAKETSGSKAVFEARLLLPGLEGRNKVYDSDGCAIYCVP